MSYHVFGEADQYAAGEYGVGSQSYYGRDAYTMPDPSASAMAPSADSGDESAAVEAPVSSSSGGGGATSYGPDTSMSVSSGATLLVGLGVVAAIGYYLFFTGSR